MKGDSSLDANRKDRIDGEASSLVYVNGSHEYVIFDPRSNEELHIGKSAHKNIQTEEPGELWFAAFILISFCILVFFIVLTCSSLRLYLLVARLYSTPSV